MKWLIFPFLVPIILVSLSLGCIHNDGADHPEEIEFHSIQKGVGTLGDTDRIIIPIFEKSLTSEEIENLKEDDGKTFSISTWETHGYGGHPYLLVNFSVHDNIEEISITWKGYGSQPWTINANEVMIYVYNHMNKIWDMKKRVNWEDGVDLEPKMVQIELSNINPYLTETDILSTIFIGPYGEGNSTGTLMNEILFAKGV